MAVSLDKTQAETTLQALVDRFIHIESILECASGGISFLLRCQEKYGFEYKLDGKFVPVKVEPEKINEDVPQLVVCGSKDWEKTEDKAGAV